MSSERLRISEDMLNFLRASQNRTTDSDPVFVREPVGVGGRAAEPSEGKKSELEIRYAEHEAAIACETPEDQKYLAAPEPTEGET